MEIDTLEQELHNAKIEIEELQQENLRLSSELVSSVKEKAKLMRKYNEIIRFYRDSSTEKN